MSQQNMETIDALAHLYPGETLQAIGSGPSLARLDAERLANGPVIAINYAIQAVEKLDLPPRGHPPHDRVYSMQKDQAFLPDCRAPILAHAHESAKNGDFGDYVFDCERDFGIPWDTPSIVVCLHLAKLFGCSAVEFWACDSFWGDFRSYDGKVVTLDERARHYAYHPVMVRGAAARLGLSWSVR